MTRLDVIDSAIKIGLGAVIAAVSSWISLAIASRNDAKKEIRRRRLDVIQQAGMDFEKQSSVFVRLNASYLSCLTWHYSKQQNGQDFAMKNMEVVMEITDKEVGPALLELHRIEAQLVTVGCNQASKAIETFRLACTNLQSGTRHPKFQENELPTSQDFLRLSNAMGDARVKYFAMVQAEFAAD